MTETHAGDEQQPRRGRLKPLLAVLLLLVAAWLVVRQLLPPPGPDMEPPEITTVGLPPGAVQQVAQQYEQVKADPESAKAWGSLGMILVSHNSHTEGEKCFLYAQALDPEAYEWPYLLGVSLSANDPPKAVGPLREAISLRGDLAVAHVRLAELLLELNEFEEAAKHLDVALRGEPDNLHGLIASARMHLATGDLDASLKSAERAAQAAPKIRAAREILAQVHQRRGERDAAKRELAAAQELPDIMLPYDDPIVSNTLELGQHDEQALKRAGELIRKNRLREAIELLGAAWEDNPTDPDIPSALARAAAQANQPGLAAAVLDRAADQHPTSAVIRLQRGVLYYLQQDFASAAKSFQEAVHLKPDYTIAYFYLGEASDKQNDREDAVSAYESAVRLDPNHGAAHRSLGRVHLEEGRLEPAQTHLEKALELLPNDAQTVSLLKRLKQPSD